MNNDIVNIFLLLIICKTNIKPYETVFIDKKYLI